MRLETSSPPWRPSANRFLVMTEHAARFRHKQWNAAFDVSPAAYPVAREPEQAVQALARVFRRRDADAAA